MCGNVHFHLNVDLTENLMKMMKRFQNRQLVMASGSGLLM